MRPQCPGGSTTHFPKRMGEGPVYMESSGETTYHKCHKTESCKHCSKLLVVTENKQNVAVVIHFKMNNMINAVTYRYVNKMRGTKSPILTNIAKT